MDRLLQVKLAIPNSRRVTSRPRVVARLDEILDARLTLLSAPPGFGKSTALVDWLSRRDAKAGWLTLDPADNDYSRFLRYLWAAAMGLSGDGAKPLDAGPSNAAVEVVDEICAFLAERRNPCVLVLDDYHVIDSARVQEAVSQLVEHLPEQAHLVIATRSDPALGLARLRAHGQLLEIRSDILRFAKEEARAFFAERMGLTLSEPDLDALLDKSEGWPAVLQLAGVSLAGGADASAFVRDFAASHRHVLDFISEEVLTRLDSGERDFLLRTSVLDRLSGALCDAVTGGSDGQEMLERLERRNVLIVGLDQERRWYRYHRLFADLLRSQLTAQDPPALPALHQRASRWYEDQGEIDEAVEYAFRALDYDRAAGLITRSSGRLINTGQFNLLRAWVRRLPPAVVEGRVFLSAMTAWAAVLSGAPDEAEASLASVDASLRDALAENDPLVLTVPAHVAMIRSVLARQRNDFEGAIAQAEGAVALVPQDLPRERAALVAGDAQAILGHARLAAGDLDRAIDAYRAATPLLELGGNPFGLAEMTRNLARLELRRGRAPAALEACDDVLARTPSDADGPAMAPVHLARAEILGQLVAPGAQEAADRALALARRGGDPATARDARALLERLALRPAETPVPAWAGRRLIEPLSERELEVLRLVAAGRSNGQIAEELYLALGTVKAHIHAISGKLGASNRVEAVAIARELGLL
jgi:LuxR family maltose regulon positive regulatory protein